MLRTVAALRAHAICLSTFLRKPQLQEHFMNNTAFALIGLASWAIIQSFMLVGVRFPFALKEPYFQSLDQSPIDKCADRYYCLASFERGTEISRGLSI
jgi:hypothetical protein